MTTDERVVELEALNRGLTAERDRLMEKVIAARAEASEQRKRAEQAEAIAAELRQALDRWGHDPSECERARARRYAANTTTPCDCHLAALLVETAP